MANLTPEQLERLRQAYARSSSGWSPNQPINIDGTTYQASFGGQGQGMDAQPGTMDAIYSYDPNKMQAGQDQFNVYNPDGTFSNEGTFKTDDAMQTFLMALAAAGGMQFLPAMGAGGGAGYGALGATEPIASIGASGGMTSAELAAIGAGGSGLGTMAPLSTLEVGANVLPEAMELGGALSGAAKWLGPAATLLGAAAGAKGQKTEETSSRKTDPRVDPYLFGANGQPGLLQMTYDKLAGQMAPGGLQGYDDMQTVGKGLLNAPVAGNGFGLFGRYR